MDYLTHNYSVRFPLKKQIAPLMAGMFLFMAFMTCPMADQDAVAATADDDSESGDWVFDKSTYTNDPKSGKRVDQYKKEKTAYRDPNAWFDSPQSMFLYDDSFYGGFNYEFSPIYNMVLWPELYEKYYFGEDGSGYYPYDGDPNDEEDQNKS